VCLAGHVVIGDRAIIGGQSGVRQFVHIGTRAMVGGHSAVDADVIPYGLVKGNRAALHGLNLVGLRRSKVQVHSAQQVVHSVQ
jgi:UDP-N-acetylglucosamine acyltransferase